MNAKGRSKQGCLGPRLGCEANVRLHDKYYVVHLPVSLCQVQPVLWSGGDPGLPPWDRHSFPREWGIQETHPPTGPHACEGAVPGLFEGREPL